MLTLSLVVLFGLVTVMAQRGFPANCLPSVVGATVAGTPAGISTVVAMGQYADSPGSAQLTYAITLDPANPPTAIQVNLEGNDVDPNNANAWVVLESATDLVSSIHFVNQFPRWVRLNVVQYTGPGNVAGQIGVK